MLPQVGSQRCWSGSICHNIEKAWVLLTLGTHMRVGMLLALPLLLESSSSNSQTQKKHLEADPESSPKRNRHQNKQKLISAVAELGQDWAGMNYTHHLLFCENYLHNNTTLPFILHQTTLVMQSPLHAASNAPSDTKRGDPLMPQLRDGAYINHFTSSFLNAWKVPFSQWKKTPSHMFRSICFIFWSKHKNWIILFSTEKYDAGFLHFVSALRQKETYKKKHIWNP